MASEPITIARRHSACQIYRTLANEAHRPARRRQTFDHDGFVILYLFCIFYFV